MLVQKNISKKKLIIYILIMLFMLVGSAYMVYDNFLKKPDISTIAPAAIDMSQITNTKPAIKNKALKNSENKVTGKDFLLSPKFQKIKINTNLGEKFLNSKEFLNLKNIYKTDYNIKEIKYGNKNFFVKE